MKTISKRIILLLLSLAVVISMSAVSFADSGTTIASKSSTGLADGTYTVTVKPDLSGSGGMFYIASEDKNTCKLTVQNGVMTATIRLNSSGYDKLYMGAAADAPNHESSWINYVEDADHYYTFQIPVSAFDKDLAVAAYGTKGKAWHDHTLTFSYTAASVTPAKTNLKSVKAAKKSAKLTWSEQSTNTAGYQIRYSLMSSMSKAKSVKVANKTTTSKTISKLKSGKKYYFQIRTYNKVGSKSYYSSWSSKKSVKVK